MTANVVVLRALGLGDLLTAVPALRALRRAQPDARLVLATPVAFEPLVGLVEGIDHVHDSVTLDSFAWSGPRPDLAIDMHGRGPESHRALLTTHPRRLVAFNCPGVGVPGPAWDPHEHETLRWCRLLSESLDVTVDPYDGLLRRPGSAPAIAGALAVHPGAATPARRWPAERYADLARRLSRKGPVVITGSAAEEALVTFVAEAAGLSAEHMLVGLPLVELAAVVAAADLVVSGDTGMAHLAAAYDRPAVALFGPTPPEAWAPRWGRTVALWRGTGSSDPHARAADPALVKLDVEAVWEAVVSQLASGATV